MAIKSDAQRQAVQRYNTKNYDQIQIRVKKGTRERIAQAAADAGFPDVSKFIKAAVSEKMGEKIE